MLFCCVISDNGKKISAKSFPWWSRLCWNETWTWLLIRLCNELFAAFLLTFALGGTSSGLGTTRLASVVTPLQGLVIEMILTFFLVNTVYNAAVNGKAGNLSGLAIGSTLAFSISMGGPLTSALLNPARTPGPDLVTGNFTNTGIYFVGPPLVDILAALFYIGILKPSKDCLLCLLRFSSSTPRLTC